MNKQRLVIVGAGPIGLEAALRAAHDGYDVTVLERGRIGDAVRRWGHVRLFTPFAMNSSKAGRHAACTEITPDAILSGAEFVSRYLCSLAKSAQLRGRVLEGHEVVAASRATYGKSDRIGRPDRREQPFRILTRTPEGEQIVEADLLMDCTGFMTLHRHVGAGGIPCPGEDLLHDQHHQIPDSRQDDQTRFAGRHTLVVGSGYSAATSICRLAELIHDAPTTRVSWITRGSRAIPVSAIPDDPLPERVRLTETANQLATTTESCVNWMSGPLIESVDRIDGKYRFCLSHSQNDSGEGRVEQILVDEVIANVGYRPDSRPFEELQIHRCYATEGPIKLAAHLLGETSSDCLRQSSGGAVLLKNPEPNFYILGAASYGRDTRFLLQTGLQQVAELFDVLKSGRAGVTS